MSALDLIPLGVPGAGKGTAAKLISKEISLPHVSTGEILRALDRDSTLGRQVFALIDVGDYVPDEMIAEVIALRLQAPDATRGVILDGFPRTVPQLSMYDALAERLGRSAVFVELRLPEQVAVARLRHRNEGRVDDTAEVIDNRVDVYHELTTPLLKALEDQGRLCWVDAGQSPAAVAHSVIRCVGPRATA